MFQFCFKFIFFHTDFDGHEAEFNEILRTSVFSYAIFGEIFDYLTHVRLRFWQVKFVSSYGRWFSAESLRVDGDAAGLGRLMALSTEYADAQAMKSEAPKVRAGNRLGVV